MTVLVTHIERKTLDPLFRALLMKQFTVDDKGQKTIRVGEMEYAYHPDFCLYLSTQSPLFLKGQPSASVVSCVSGSSQHPRPYCCSCTIDLDPKVVVR